MKNLGLLILSLLILLCGCSKLSSVDLVREDVLEYLNKYDDTFTVKAMVSKTSANDTDNIYVYSELYDGVFVVKKFAKDYTDNYFSLVMQEDARNYVKGLIYDDFEVSVKFTEDDRPSYLNDSSTFQEYKENGGSTFCHIILRTDRKLTSNEIEAIISRFADDRFKCVVEIYGGEEYHKYRVNDEYAVVRY